MYTHMNMLHTHTHTLQNQCGGTHSTRRLRQKEHKFEVNLMYTQDSILKRETFSKAKVFL